VKKRISKWIHQFHVEYENKRKEKEIAECEKMNKQMD
jgi:hypothetical protein